MPEAEVIALMQRCSNSGRWGPDDELGTLNFITPQKRLEALRLVTIGRVVSVARDIDTVRSSRNPHPVVHRMLNVDERAPAEAVDVTEIAPHGYAITHMDAVGHGSFAGSIYNGRRAAEEILAEGLRFGSILAAAEGVVTRGVLLDVAAARGVDWLSDDEGVWPEDLEAAERFSGVEVGRGDAVLVRVGLGARERVEGPEDPGRRAGLVAECVPWLHAREVAAYGGDCIEQLPQPYQQVKAPLHQIGLAAMGLSLLDVVEMEQLATVCRELGRYEFLIVYAPLRIPGGTGSAVNPLCVF
jgi:kynurenine formamidase